MLFKIEFELTIRRLLHELKVVLRKLNNLYAIVTMCSNWYDALLVYFGIKKRAIVRVKPGLTINLAPHSWYNFLCLVKLLKKRLAWVYENKVKFEHLDLEVGFSELGEIYRSYIFYREAVKKIPSFKVHKHGDDYIVHLLFHGKPLAFYIKHWWLDAFIEIFHEKVYDDQSIKKVDVVIDIGATFGDSSIFLLQRGREK